MGYYSDVAVRIEIAEGYDVNKVIENFKENFNNEYEVFDLENHLHYVKRGIVICGYSLKWYDSFGDVQAFYKWCEEQEADNENIEGIHFVRIGEDLDDIEERVYGELWDYIHIRRDFEWD